MFVFSPIYCLKTVVINFAVHPFNICEKYPKMKDFKSLEPAIEREYLEYLYDDCSSIINYKNRLQYYMAISYSRYEKEQYKRKLDQLDYGSCNKYNSLKNYIR